MAMLKRSQKDKIVSTTILNFAVAAGVIFVGLLLMKAIYLSGPTDKALIQQGSLGPISLFELQKVPAGELGYKVSIQFLLGSLTYTALWSLIALAVILLRLKRSK